MSTFKIKNSLGTIVEVPNEHRKHIEKLLADDKHSEIDTFINNLPKRQMGGQEQGNEQQLQQIVQSVAQAIQQGADPNQVLQELVKQGIPQDKAQQLVQYVVSQIQGQQPQQTEDDMPVQPEMMEGGMLYQDQWKLPQDRQKILLAEEGGELDEMKKGGSSIHIKESHKGRFTRYKERTGKTTQEALHSKDPHVRKMAQFAVNAKKWKHEDGGELEEYGTAGQFGLDDDYLFDVTQQNTLANTQNNPLSKDLLAATQFGNYNNMMWALPNKGLLGKIKAGLGIASGLSGVALGYNKLFAKDQTKNMLSNPRTDEYGQQKDIYAQRIDKLLSNEIGVEQPNKPLDYQRRVPYYHYNNKFDNFKEGGELSKKQSGGPWGSLAGSTDTHFPNIVPPMDYDVPDFWSVGNMGTMASSIGDIVDSANIASMYKGTGNMPNFNPMAQSINNSGINNMNFATWMKMQKAKGIDPFNLASLMQQENTRDNKIQTGDPLGVIAANNSLSGMGMANEALSYQDMEKDYNQRMREMGMSVNKYSHKQPLNPFGAYTVNAGVGPNFDLFHLGQVQDIGTAKCGGSMKGKKKYEEGGEYEVTEEEMEEIKRNGGEFEILK